jgi:hypothetical protein
VLSKKEHYFSWFDRVNSLIAGVKRTSQYSFVFWDTFFKVAANFGNASKEILDANTPEDIEALRKKRIKLVLHEGNDYCSQEVALINPEIRNMVDNICFMSV